MKASSIAPLLALVSLAACSANDPGGGARATGGTSSSTGGSLSVTTGGTASSTGGAAGTAGSGVSIPTAGSTGEGENCGLQTFPLVRVPADILLVLDRSASMQDPPDGATDATEKWDLVVPALTEVINSTNETVAWGMKSYPEGEGNECIVGSVTDKIDVPIADGNAAAVNAAVTATTAEGNGTPTGDAVKQAVAYMKTLTNNHSKFLLLATDGEPSCAGTTEDTAQARTYAVQAVADALAAGYPTYVVGVATTKTSATTALNNMATAGGKPRADANPLATRYYLANTKDELVQSLKTITGEVNRSCVFALDPPPPHPEFTAVKLVTASMPDGVTIARDSSKSNGWDYNNGQFTSLEVFGAQCDTIQNGASEVKIVYGCANNPPR